MSGRENRVVSGFCVRAGYKSSVSLIIPVFVHYGRVERAVKSVEQRFGHLPFGWNPGAHFSKSCRGRARQSATLGSFFPRPTAGPHLFVTSEGIPEHDLSDSHEPCLIADLAE